MGGGGGQRSFLVGFGLTFQTEIRHFHATFRPEWLKDTFSLIQINRQDILCQLSLKQNKQTKNYLSNCRKYLQIACDLAEFPSPSSTKVVIVTVPKNYIKYPETLNAWRINFHLLYCKGWQKQ